MRKILTCICIMLAITGICSVCSAAPEPKAESAILASLTSEQILFSKNPDNQIKPAELTKLMTAYVTYKLYGFGTEITVPEGISLKVESGASTMSLKAGEKIKSGYLIYGMLVEQADDAAITVALHFGGVDKFAEKMNEYAKKLGMKNTCFVNSTGRDADKQLSTANDLLVLYREFYKDENLYEFISTKNIEIPATNMSEQRSYWTKNHLMSRFVYLDYVYDRATAGVSSSTSYGGFSVISSAKKGEREYVCIVLNSIKEDGVNLAMTEATEIFEYGFNNFKSVKLSKQGELVYEAKLKNQRGKGTLLLCAGKTLTAEILEDDEAESVDRKVEIAEPLKAPIKKGDTVGKFVYSYNGNYIGEVALVAERDVKRSFLRMIFGGIGWIFTLPLVKIIVWGAIIVLIIMVLTAYVRAMRIKKRRRNRRRRYRKF